MNVLNDSTSHVALARDSERPHLLFVAPPGDDDDLLASLESAGYATTQAHSVEAGLRAASSGGVRVLLWDTDTPGGGTLEFLRGIAARVPTVLVVSEPTVPTAVSALRLGLLDYLVKPLAVEQLLPTLENAMRVIGQRRATQIARETVTGWIETLDSLREALPPWGEPGELVRSGRPRTGLEPAVDVVAVTLRGRDGRLSLREREVVQLLSQGRSVSIIARTLSISPHTVRNHLKAVFRKVGVHSQVELVSRAREFLA